MRDPKTPGDTPGGPSPGPPSVIVGFRVLILILAAGAAAAAISVAVRARRAAIASEVRYICPMHPEVRSAGPGECPICRMALEPATRGGAVAGRATAAMADMTAVENVRKHNIVEFVRRRSLLPNLRELRGPAAVGDDGAITAVLYDDQIEALAADETGTFRPAAAPDQGYTVRRAADPAVSWDLSTSKLRFRLVAAAQPPLRPGQAGWLELPHKAREVLGVPTSALLQSPEGPYVLAWAGGRRFEKRSVRIGETFTKQGFAVVLSGLRPHDRVVSRAAFFVDADRRLGNHADDGDGDGNGDGNRTWGAP